MINERLLKIYLNDHLAGSVAGHQLVGRVLSNNQEGELGNFLRELKVEIEADRDELLSVMKALAMHPDPAKQAGGWLAEKAGRLKLNGRLRGYSPLSRLVELEGLCVGVEGKKELWLALERIASEDARLARFDLDGLASKAQKQRDELERHRLRAAEVALTA